VKNAQKRHDAAGMGHNMQGVESLCIRNFGICAVCDEELNDIEVSVASGPLQGGSDEVSPPSVDFSALFEEVLACGELRVDCCPVEGGYILRVSVRC
jgi:hypothetical protein